MKYLFKIIKIIFSVALMTIFWGCEMNDTAETERQPAKNIIGLVSEGTYNIFADVHDLAGSDAEGWTEGIITARISGEVDDTKSITVSLAEDPALLDAYNKSVYGTDAYRYAEMLPSDKYSIINPQLSFPNPDTEREARFRIRVKTVGLSPDMRYFIPLKVDKTTANELDLKKNTILYQVYYKNAWASTLSNSRYDHTGKRAELLFPFSEGQTTTAHKDVFPISAYEVRTLAGNKTIGANDILADVYEKWAMRLSIAADGKVTITPWSSSDSGLHLEQMDDDPDYPNRYRLAVDEQSGNSYHSFLLNYKYYDPDANRYYWMREELRMKQE